MCVTTCLKEMNIQCHIYFIVLLLFVNMHSKIVGGMFSLLSAIR